MAREKDTAAHLKETSLLFECDIFNKTVPEDLRALRNFSQLYQPEKPAYAPYRFLYYDTINSTNDTAKAGDYPHGTVIIANAQDKGRGRGLRHWHSPPGVNISMSIVLKPDEEIPALSLMNTATSLAVSRALGAATTLDVWPKWPNDIYIGAKKVGGILSETLISGGMVRRLVVGIGVNVNTAEFPAELRDKATSLFIESGAMYDRGQLIASILREFDQCRALSSTHLISEWTALSKTINSYVYVSGADGKVVQPGGTARALNEDGSLVVELEAGIIATVTSGEVTNAPCH
ncbi:biotin--[acetyl-CoA-carboxylase] ligase [Candidatus Magnetominusculus dajiuhuensis]|uniref:biotin--[acetyl-CoA-carboxylase] ligase n=1 Tax=Candidatus Magnetominusculus dajiuhuensis TaxID=3137712 RepID=UPI003B438326